jgi:hypothetical protein
MATRRRRHAAVVRRNDKSKLLTAAATRIDLESKQDAELQRKVRQNWQIQAWCVDEETEILTRRGWLNYRDVEAGDVTLTLNHETGVAEWNEIESVNIFTNEPRIMLSMESRGHSSLTTPNHRWPVMETQSAWIPSDAARRKARRHGRRQPPSGERPPSTISREWSTTETLTKVQSMVTAAPVAELPIEAKFSDAFVELMAWFWTEGYARENGYVNIAQSYEVHPEYCGRIRLALLDVFGSSVVTTRGIGHPAWRESSARGMTQFSLNMHAGKFLLDQMERAKVVSTDFILSLTRSQLELFIQTSIDADGNRDGASERITQSERDRLDPIMLAAVLTGRSPHLYQINESCWALYLASKQTISPPKSSPLARVVYGGDVWCPMTANKTWMARRHGTVYFTGNTYYDSIPELGFAIEFMAHAAARMRIFCAVLPETGETGTPVDIHNPEMQVPDQVISACDNALRDLGNGRLELSKMMKNLSIQWSIAGEGFLIGVEDPMSLDFNYSIRSISEVVVNDDQIELREGPMTNQGVLGLVPLPPNTMVTRLWNPHPQYRLLAQSRMRALLDTCEDLMILRRMIRAVGRNRIAGRGIVFMPSEAQLPIFNDDDDSIGGATFYDEFTNAMITPIRNEGDASGVVPMITEMAGDLIDKVRWLEFTSTFDEHAGAIRSELLDTLATGLDLPKEVITGMADLNHWTEWAIDANTFRYHIEPHVMELTDVLTVGYLRSAILTSGLDPAMANAWVNRILFWHDPTELVTAPDQTTVALNLHDRLVISNAALLRIAGFSEEDAPDADEYLSRLISKQRTCPANLSLGVVHAENPELAIPAITTPGTIPGIDPVEGVIVPAAPALPVGATTPPIGDAPPPPTEPIPAQPGPPAMASSGAPHRVAWALTSIDRELRARLQVTANDEMRRQLEKLGVRLKQKVAKNATLRKKIAMTHIEHVAMMLGKEVVEASGFLTATGNLNTDWSDLKTKFMSWTKAAQDQALNQVTKFAGLSDAQISKAQSLNEDNREKAWETLKLAMDSLAVGLIYNPDPNVNDEDQIASLNPDSLVPAGVVRSALAVAGGALASTLISGIFNGASVPISPASGVPSGVALGPTLQGTLADAGTTTTGYEWVHGPTDRPFDPHLDLDGQEFATWTDEVLASDGGWPYVPYYYPGDHDGCLCDAMPQWAITSGEPGTEATETPE